MRDDRLIRELDSEAHLTDPDRRTRRTFLKNTALATGASTALLAVSPQGAAAASTSTLPYQRDNHWLKSHIQEIVSNETTHLQTLVAELGPFARPKPTFRNLAPANLQQFITRGALFCSTGAGAYLGAGPAISNPDFLSEAGSLGQVELTQSGFLYSLLDQPLIPGGSAFAPALTLAQVLDRAAPFIADLNGGPPPVFDPSVKSVENDIAIFNVALVLEYLEVEFYTTYFPIFFP